MSTNLMCPDCYRIFDRKTGLDYHLSHKVCEKSKDKECPKCHKVLSSRQMCQYHVLHEVCGNSSIANKTKIPLKLKPQVSTSTLLPTREPTKEELLIKVAMLEAQNKILCEHPQTIIQQTINYNFPHAFGTEDIHRILSKKPSLLHDAITKHTDRSVEYMTEQIHCDNDVFPEYANVYLRGRKSQFALVSNGKCFQNKPQKRIIDQIIENTISMLQTYIDYNGEKIGQRIIDKYEKYQDLVEEPSEHEKKSERRKDLEIEIAGLLLDMRPIIEENPTIKRMLDQLEEGSYVDD